MAAFAIPVAAAGGVSHGIGGEVVAVPGRWYSWQRNPCQVDNNAEFFSPIHVANPAFPMAFPLVIPFAGTWDRVGLVTNQTDVTDGYRMGLYLGNTSAGRRPPTDAGDVLFDGVIPPPALPSVTELIVATIDITEDAGTVVWCYFVIDDTAGAGTNRVIYYGQSADVWGLGSEHTVDMYGTGLGSKVAGVSTGRAGGDPMGDPPPEIFGGNFNDDSNYQRNPIVQFRYSALP